MQAKKPLNLCPISSHHCNDLVNSVMIITSPTVAARFVVVVNVGQVRDNASRLQRRARWHLSLSIINFPVRINPHKRVFVCRGAAPPPPLSRPG